MVGTPAEGKEEARRSGPLRNHNASGRVGGGDRPPAMLTPYADESHDSSFAVNSVSSPLRCTFSVTLSPVLFESM